MKLFIKRIFVVLLMFTAVLFVSCDKKTPDKGYLTDEEVIEIINGFNQTAKYSKYSVEGTFNYLDMEEEVVPGTVSRKNVSFQDALDIWDINSASYYLRMPLHLTTENWNSDAIGTKDKIIEMLVTSASTLDKVYFYSDGNGGLVIKTFGANKNLYIKRPSEVKCYAKWNVTITYNSEGYLVSEKFETINAHKEPDSETCYGEATYTFAE